MTLLFRKPTLRLRSIQKVAKALPKSLRKRKEVISALAKQTQAGPTQLKAGRPKYELTKNEKEWFKNFLDKLDITNVTAGRKYHPYFGKVDGKSQYVQKRYLTWTLY